MNRSCFGSSTSRPKLNTWLASRVRAVLYPIAFKYLELGHEIGIDLWLKIMEEAKEDAQVSLSGVTSSLLKNDLEEQFRVATGKSFKDVGYRPNASDISLCRRYCEDSGFVAGVKTESTEKTTEETKILSGMNFGLVNIPGDRIGMMGLEFLTMCIEDNGGHIVGRNDIKTGKTLDVVLVSVGEEGEKLNKIASLDFIKSDIYSKYVVFSSLKQGKWVSDADSFIIAKHLQSKPENGSDLDGQKLETEPTVASQSTLPPATATEQYKDYVIEMGQNRRVTLTIEEKDYNLLRNGVDVCGVKMMIFSELGKYFAANGDVSLELAVDEIRKLDRIKQRVPTKKEIWREIKQSKKFLSVFKGEYGDEYSAFFEWFERKMSDIQKK